MVLRTAALAVLILAGAAAGAMSQPSAPAAQSLAAPDCEKPDSRALQNRPGNDSSEIMAYNAKVHRFNRMSEAFTACTKAYVENVSRAIDRLRGQTQDRQKQIVEQANARIHLIEAEINAAVAVGNGGIAPPIANPDPDLPPAACEAPKDTAPGYADRRRIFETCTRDYIDRGKVAMQRAKDDADRTQQQIAADANRRIQLLNSLAQLVADGDNDAARRTIAQLNTP